jgi:prepilin signal peptidase PulO-like enzyme (type II secretory pathway)
MTDYLIEIINKINTFKNNFLTLKFFVSFQPGLDLNSFLFLINWFILLFMIFMIGASFCGFFQCMIYRQDKKMNLWITRSFCDYCGKTLKWIDPVPFINYLILKGKCRYCHTQLPPKYFLSETLSGIILLFLVIAPFNILFTLPFALFMIFVTAYGIYFNRLNRIIIGFLALFIGLFIIIYGFGGMNILISLGLMLLLGFLEFRIKKPELNGEYLVFLCLFSLIIQPVGIAIGILLARTFSIIQSLSWKIHLQRYPKEVEKHEEPSILNKTISLIGYYTGFIIFLAFMQ